MKPIEETHPSLVNRYDTLVVKRFRRPLSNKQSVATMMSTDDLILDINITEIEEVMAVCMPLDDIQKHTVDKQVLKEILSKVEQFGESEGRTIDAIRERLGLDK